MVWVLRRPPALRAFMAASGPKPSDSQPAGHKPAFWSFDEPNWLYSELKLSFLQVHYANKNFHQKNQSKTKKLKSKWWQCFSTLELRVIREFRPKKRPFEHFRLKQSLSRNVFAFNWQIWGTASVAVSHLRKKKKEKGCFWKWCTLDYVWTFFKKQLQLVIN